MTQRLSQYFLVLIVLWILAGPAPRAARAGSGIAAARFALVQAAGPNLPAGEPVGCTFVIGPPYTLFLPLVARNFGGSGASVAAASLPLAPLPRLSALPAVAGNC